MKPVRILHLTSKTFGGIEAYVFNCYRHMDRERFQFDFITQNPGLKDAEQYRDLPYCVHLLRTTAALDRDGFARRVREILENGRYDVLHLHTSYWTGFLIEEIAKEIGLPKVIVHSHNSSVEENDDLKRPLLAGRHEELKRAFSADLATDFWACSRLAADWLFGPQIPREKIQIMKYGINLEPCRFDGKKRGDLRQSLGLENCLVLGTLGRMSYQKNHKFLIDLFGALHKKNPRSRLLILGDGERREQTEEQIRRKNLGNSVILLGRRNNAADYLQAMDCFLLPSRFEGLPLSVLEAAASGLPCVISDSIAEETAFTERIRRVPLDTVQWVSAVEEMAEIEVNRADGADLVREAGYDAAQQAALLEEQYKIR